MLSHLILCVVDFSCYEFLCVSDFLCGCLELVILSVADKGWFGRMNRTGYNKGWFGRMNRTGGNKGWFGRMNRAEVIIIRFKVRSTYICNY